MSHKTVPVNFGGHQYDLRFGALGAYLLQKETGIGILEFAQKVEENSIGFLELHALLWAELESTRKATHFPPIPWTIESVGDLIDGECGGDLVEFWRTKNGPIVEAFKNSFAITIKAQEELARRAAEARGSDEDPTSVAATSTGDSPATGTTVSTTPPRSASRRKPSGG
jgi:hypothetical protein